MKKRIILLIIILLLTTGCTCEYNLNITGNKYSEEVIITANTSEEINNINKEWKIPVDKEEYDYLYENRKPKVNHPPYKKDKNRINEMNKRLCFDPIKQENCFYSTLTSRKHAHKEEYKDVIVKNCLI